MTRLASSLRHISSSAASLVSSATSSSIHRPARCPRLRPGRPCPASSPDDSPCLQPARFGRSCGCTRRGCWWSCSCSCSCIRPVCALLAGKVRYIAHTELGVHRIEVRSQSRDLGANVQFMRTRRTVSTPGCRREKECRRRGHQNDGNTFHVASMAMMRARPNAYASNPQHWAVHAIAPEGAGSALWCPQ